jgi:hypothetical protein
MALHQKTAIESWGPSRRRYAEVAEQEVEKSSNNFYWVFKLRRQELGKVQGDVAQLVEQRTENPCVGGSIPSVTTSNSLQ